MRSKFLSYLISGLSSLGSTSYIDSIPPMSFVTNPKRQHATGKVRSWRSRGVWYPHSSARQRARYARQILAGQLNIMRVAP